MKNKVENIFEEIELPTGNTCRQKNYIPILSA